MARVTEQRITPEMVQKISPLRRDAAERIADYANHRLNGLRPVDARNEVGISDRTCGSYERFLPRLLSGLGLPPLPEPGPIIHPRDERAYAAKGGHQMNHVQRGVVHPGCTFCNGGPS